PDRDPSEASYVALVALELRLGDEPGRQEAAQHLELGDSVDEEMLPRGRELSGAAGRTREQIGKMFSCGRGGWPAHDFPPPWPRFCSTRFTITLPISARAKYARVT